LEFEDPHRKYLPVEPRLSKIHIEKHGTGSKPDNCPRPPDVPCLFDPDSLDLAQPVVLAGLEIDGQ
jgi:hypothetical protein